MHPVVIEPEKSLRLDEQPLLLVALDSALRRWRWVAVATFLAGAIGVPMSLRMPPWYIATVRLMPAPSRHGAAGGAYDFAAGSSDPAVPGGAEGQGELGRLLSLLRSRSLTDDTIRHFNLMAAFRARNLDDMREFFWGRLAVSALQVKEGYVELSIEDLDPQRAAAIANFMATHANELSRRFTSAAAREQREFLEHRIDDLRRAVDLAADEYRAFQEQNKLVNIEEQADAVIATMMRLKEQLIQRELDLRKVRSFASDEEPATIVARRQVRDLREKLEDLESAPTESPDFFTRLEMVPGLRVESERLARDLRVKSALYESLVKDYETAKLAEVRDTRTFAVLDAAVAPTRKSRPNRLLAAVGVGLGGFALSFGAMAGLGVAHALRRRNASLPG